MRNLMEVLMVTRNDSEGVAARYGVDETGLMVHVVNDAEEAIGKLQNVNYEIVICDLALEADDAQRVMAVTQQQLPDTVRLSLDTTNVPATTEMIRQTARRLVQAQEARRVTVTDGITAPARQLQGEEITEDSQYKTKG